MRAMVIDDSRSVRMIVGQMLKEMGHEVIEAGDGRQAFEKLQASQPVGLMMVDWNMPEMNGYELVCAVRARPEFNDVRIVMVTTENEIDQMVKAVQAGANEYIMKPFTREVIQEKLALIGVPSKSQEAA